MLWLIPIAAFFVYCLFQGRNTVRSCENAANSQIDARIDFLLSDFQEQEDPKEQRLKMREREKGRESELMKGPDGWYLRNHDAA